MIVGDSSVFAIESGLTAAYERLSLRGLGFFIIHVGGYCYGVRAPRATALALPYDGIGKRIADRGKHTAPFSTEPDPGKIAGAFRNAIYAEEQEESFFGVPLAEFIALDHSSHLSDWTTQFGDEAFDDGSYVLQFDVDDRVRLIGYKSGGVDYRHAEGTLRDVWLPGDDFYAILQYWRDAFVTEWAASPKISEATYVIGPRHIDGSGGKR
jgi:hypothetical protein